MAHIDISYFQMEYVLVCPWNVSDSVYMKGRVLSEDISNIAFQVTRPISCQALSIFINLSARVGMACASGLLALRTIALWQKDRRVVVGLALLSLGQWALFLHNIFIVRESWSSVENTCILEAVGDAGTKAQFIYSKPFRVPRI
jgi:hypothetical protein